jgi:hypothetical protein
VCDSVVFVAVALDRFVLFLFGAKGIIDIGVGCF